MFTSILFMFTSMLFALAQASLPASPVEVRKEDSALLPISGAVLNNVYGKGDIANYRQLVFRGKDDAGWEWDWPESGGPSLKNYPEVLLGRSPWSNAGGFVIPRRLAGELPLEVPCDGAGGEDMAVASFPALLAFLKFTGPRLLRVSGFALLPAPPIEIQGHA